MNGWARARQAVRRHPYVLDTLLAVLLFAGPLATLLVELPPRNGPQFVLTGPSIAVGAVGYAALAVRRRWPLQVLAVTTIAGAAAILLTDGKTPYTVAAAVAAYTVAVTTDRRTAWSAGLAVATVMVGSEILASGSAFDAQNFGPIAWTGMAVAIGDALRSRRAYLAAVEERAHRAEQSREEEAARRVVEERLRIARELHDVVAHHIALINVQAGVAAHMLRVDPDATEAALAHVREASRTVLAELSTTLGVLRGNDEPAAVTEPAPGLERLGDLVDTFTRAGLGIDLVTSGRPRQVPAAVDLAAYRIVQESLTNAQKHGRGATATVRVDHRAGELRIEVRNGPPVRGEAAPAGQAGKEGGGHGLVGMRERALSVGGALRAGPEPGGGFAVVATLPLPAENTRVEGDRGYRPSTAR